MSNPVYDVDYFIAKFEAIPDERIGNESMGAHCASWHCGARSYEKKDETPELLALADLFAALAGQRAYDPFMKVYFVNDGCLNLGRFGDTPRARILAALREIKGRQ